VSARLGNYLKGFSPAKAICGKSAAIQGDLSLFANLKSPSRRRK
jgi:hypothetical protein